MPNEDRALVESIYTEAGSEIDVLCTTKHN